MLQLGGGGERQGSAGCVTQACTSLSLHSLFCHHLGDPHAQGLAPEGAAPIACYFRAGERCEPMQRLEGLQLLAS